MRLASQIVGSIAAAALLASVVYFFPITIFESTWREEQMNYERAMKNRIKFHEEIDVQAVNFDRIIPTNLTGEQLECIWKEENARAMLIENMMLVDKGITQYPTKNAYYISTALATLAMIPAVIICASMVTVYERVAYKILYYCTGMNNSISKMSIKYARSSITRDGIIFAIALAGLVGVFSQMAAFAYLQSGKTWSFGTVIFWTAIQIFGAGNMHIKLPYMKAGKISLWLAMVEFSCYLNAASTIAFVLISGLRCWQSREIIGVQQFTDEQVHKAILVDKERSKECVKRPLFHN